MCLGKALAKLEIQLRAVGLLRQCRRQLAPDQDLSLAPIPSPSSPDELRVVAAGRGGNSTANS
jgi:cytochrome P450